MRVNGLKEVGESEICFTISLSSYCLTEPGLQKWDCPSHPGICRDCSGLPFPKGDEEAAEQDMAAPSGPCPDCQNVTGYIDHGINPCLSWSLVMVWWNKSLPVECSSFYCQPLEVSEVLRCWEGQQNLVFGDFFLSGKPGRNLEQI